MEKISSFRGEYSFLSNMFPSPLKYGGLTYRNAEAAYQAQKCANADDRKRFGGLDGADAEKLGRAVALRADWEGIKVRAMTAVVRAKFSQNGELLGKLAATGDAILEDGNDRGDAFWGTADGKGENRLGRILMDVRADLAATEENPAPEGAAGRKCVDGLCDELDLLLKKRIQCKALDAGDLAEGGRYHKAYVKLLGDIRQKAGEIMKLYLHLFEPKRGTAAWQMWRQACEDDVRETRDRAHWALFEAEAFPGLLGDGGFSPSGEFLAVVALTEFHVREDVKAAAEIAKRKGARSHA